MRLGLLIHFNEEEYVLAIPIWHLKLKASPLFSLRTLVIYVSATLVNICLPIRTYNNIDLVGQELLEKVSKPFEIQQSSVRASNYCSLIPAVI